jgi:hypothetical protein
VKVDLVETAPFHNEEKLSITLGGGSALYQGMPLLSSLELPVLFIPA